MRGILLAATTTFVLCAFQPDWRTPANFHDNRYEALIRIKRNTSAPPLELVSFGAPFEGYPGSKDFSLRVHFFLPTDQPAAFVQATELDEDLQYRMESKVNWKPKTCNTFEGWRSDVALNKVPASNLGVVVRLDGSSADFRRFSPAVVVADSKSAPKPGSYLAVMRIGTEPIQSLRWSLYSKNNNRLTPVASANVPKSFRSASHATIEINAGGLKNGWYRLVMQAPYSARPGTADYAFDFYNRVEPCLR
jgi:hypothetical protein